MRCLGVQTSKDVAFMLSHVLLFFRNFFTIITICNSNFLEGINQRISVVVCSTCTPCTIVSIALRYLTIIFHVTACSWLGDSFTKTLIFGNSLYFIIISQSPLTSYSCFCGPLPNTFGLLLSGRHLGSFCTSRVPARGWGLLSAQRVLRGSLLLARVCLLLVCAELQPDSRQQLRRPRQLLLLQDGQLELFGEIRDLLTLIGQPGDEFPTRKGDAYLRGGGGEARPSRPGAALTDPPAAAAAASASPAARPGSGPAGRPPPPCPPLPRPLGAAILAEATAGRQGQAWEEGEGGAKRSALPCPPCSLPNAWRCPPAGCLSAGCRELLSTRGAAFRVLLQFLFLRGV